MLYTNPLRGYGPIVPAGASGETTSDLVVRQYNQELFVVEWLCGWFALMVCLNGEMVTQ